MSGQYSDLTQAQQEAISNTSLLVVEALLSARKTLTLMQTAVLDSTVSSAAAIAALSSGTTIPNPSSLAGSGQISVDQLNQMLANFSGLLSAWNTTSVQQLHAQFIGAANINGR
jgi:hypothetical protein